MSSVQALFPRFPEMDLEMELELELETDLETELDMDLEMVGFHLNFLCNHSSNRKKVYISW